MKTLHTRSYAKINLCLNIVGKREDGYHKLDMILLPISLHDSLIISKLNTTRDNLVTVDDFLTVLMNIISPLWHSINYKRYTNLIKNLVFLFTKSYQFKRV